MLRIRNALCAAGLVCALALTFSSCALYDSAVSTTVTRNDAIQLALTTKTLQDVATATINGCVATESTKGVCAPSAVDAVHKALVATREPRDALLEFADEHAGSELGAVGLYDALLRAKDSLLSVLAQYGVTIPPTGS